MAPHARPLALPYERRRGIRRHVLGTQTAAMLRRAPRLAPGPPRGTSRAPAAPLGHRRLCD
eukprot:11222709-Lingulodinium_polyedra.AAC.1